MDLKRIVYISALALLLIALKLIVSSLSRGQTVVEGSVETEDGATLFYIAHLPTGEGSKPLAILMHGFGGSSEMMDIIANELANNGILTIAYDTRGHGKSGSRLSQNEVFLYDDFLKIVDLAEKYNARTSEIALIGHSMGAGFAQSIAKDDSRIGCLVLMGAQPSSTYLSEESEVNVLVVNGQNDQITSVGQGLEAFKNITGIRDPEIGKTYGSFDDTSAREFYVSGFNDHLTVLYSSDSVRKAVGWVARFYQMHDLTFSNDLRLSANVLTVIVAYLAIFPLLGEMGDRLGLGRKQVQETFDVSRIALVYLVACFLAAPPALLLQPLLMMLTPLFFSNFLLAFFYSQILAIGATLYAYKKATGRGFRELLGNYLSRDKTLRRITYSLLSAAIVYVLYYIGLQQFLNLGMSTFKLGYAAVSAILLVPYAVFNETFFRAVIGALRRGFAYQLLLTAFLRASSLVILYTTLMIVLAGTNGMTGFLSIVVYMTALIQLSFDVISAYMFRKKASITEQVVWSTIVYAVMLTAISPAV